VIVHEEDPWVRALVDVDWLRQAGQWAKSTARQSTGGAASAGSR
jgi:hypothetical protein